MWGAAGLKNRPSRVNASNLQIRVIAIADMRT